MNLQMLLDVYTSSKFTYPRNERLDRDNYETKDRGVTSRLGVASSPLTVRAIEYYDTYRDGLFRIVISNKIPEQIWLALREDAPGLQTSTRSRDCLDFLMPEFNPDFALKIVNYVESFFDDETVISEINDYRNNLDPVETTSTNYFEGVNLSDIDVDLEDDSIDGRGFTRKELICIFMNGASPLRTALSRKGIYQQRSVKGDARYVGLADNANGIFGRWIDHIKQNGSAKFLKEYIAENGYKDMLFYVLELSEDNLTSLENKWKEILGTRARIYDGRRLNNN